MDELRGLYSDSLFAWIGGGLGGYVCHQKLQLKILLFILYIYIYIIQEMRIGLGSILCRSRSGTIGVRI